MVPVLIQCHDSSACDLVTYIAERCSAKELLIVLAEVSEKLVFEVAKQDSGDGNETCDDDGEDTSVSLVDQSVRLIGMFAKGVCSSL